MQLGTRWDVGEEPPVALDEAVVRAIGRVEAELEADGVDATGWRWTLTWLERRPVVELDDGTRVVQDHDGGVGIIPPED
jgi:hypothetical protein